MIVVLGPTASGKTSLAVQLACHLNGEVISADSRQVYRGMDIGTGKDLSEYTIGNQSIPYHLIDIVDPGYEYNVFEFQRDFRQAYEGIISRGKVPILCGGSGLYIESVLLGYRFSALKSDPDEEQFLESKSTSELIGLLKTLRVPHNTTDILDRKRLIKSIRIGLEELKQPEDSQTFPRIDATVLGIAIPRQELRNRITKRLYQRLEEGMVDEVRRLLASGIDAQTLKFYGLEYKFITRYLQQEIGYEEMVSQLNHGIHQFAKRQVTWFRRMEKKGIKIRNI